MTGSMDPYLYPGSDVHKNLRDIRTLGILERFEAEATTRRIVESIHSESIHSEPNHSEPNHSEPNHSPAPGRFDTAHLRAIHQSISRMSSRGPASFGRSTFPKAGSYSAPPLLSSPPSTMCCRN